MGEAKVDKKIIGSRLLFLFIGAILFLLLFNLSEEINYSDPLSLIKLLGFAIYLIIGEKIIRIIIKV